MSASHYAYFCPFCMKQLQFLHEKEEIDRCSTCDDDGEYIAVQEVATIKPLLRILKGTQTGRNRSSVLIRNRQSIFLC